MNQKELNKYRRLLEKRHAELSEGMSYSRVAAVTIEERYGNEADTAQSDISVWIELRTITTQTESLWQVENALQRMRDGSFGICPKCEETIAPKRLSAVPWAEHCIKCEPTNGSKQLATNHFPPLRGAKQAAKRAVVKVR